MSMEEPQASATVQPPTAEPVKSAFGMLFDPKRVAFFGVVLAAELALFALAIVVPAGASLRQQLVAGGQGSLPSHNTTAGSLVGLIVANNLRVALLEMIPLMGFLLLPLSIFASGVIIQGFAISSAVPPTLAAFSYLLLPFTYVELSAYAVAFVSGTMLIVAWLKKRLHREARVFMLEIVAVAILVVLAATMETITISNAIAGLLLWVPLTAMVPLAIKMRRVNK